MTLHDSPCHINSLNEAKCTMSVESLALYVTVYEHKGIIIRPFTRNFMRHSGIMVKQPDESFDCFHVTGTPGIGLRYSCQRGWGNPEQETARLLAMDQVGWIPKEDYDKFGSLMESVERKISMDWNCQNWVRAALDIIQEHDFITEIEKTNAVRKQREAIELPFTSETPNKRALQDGEE